MSRGPGKWQRAILCEIDKGEWFYLVSLLPDGYSDAQYKALHRAATTLADDGRLSYLVYIAGTRRVALGPVGAERPAKRIPGYNQKYDLG